jgi:hypothetical protein
MLRFDFNGQYQNKLTLTLTLKSKQRQKGHNNFFFYKIDIYYNFC